MDFIRKRKPSNDLNMEHKIYTCEFLHCPYSELRLAFRDRISRDNHQLTCPYRTSSTTQFGGSNFHVNEVKPIIFPQTYAQQKPAPVMASAPISSASSINSVPPSFDLTGLGVPEDGQKMISELMSIYDTNVQGNSNRNMNPGNNNSVPECQNLLQAQPIYDNNFQVSNRNMNQGTECQNLLPVQPIYDTNVQGNNRNLNPSTECQNLLQPTKPPQQQQQQEAFYRGVGNSFQQPMFTQGVNSFDRFNNSNNNSSSSFQVMFGSNFDLASFDYKDDLQAIGMWNHQ